MLRLWASKPKRELPSSSSIYPAQLYHTISTMLRQTERGIGLLCQTQKVAFKEMSVHMAHNVSSSMVKKNHQKKHWGSEFAVDLTWSPIPTTYKGIEK